MGKVSSIFTQLKLERDRVERQLEKDSCCAATTLGENEGETKKFIESPLTAA
jgi:hypothetical protein